MKQSMDRESTAKVKQKSTLLQLTIYAWLQGIPNLITLANLTSGLLGIGLLMRGDLFGGFLCMLLGSFFDFFDGLLARKLGVEGTMGKQLDSLADVVSFGVLPGLIW
ncbi:MAG: CDP-alcohol phosphatidyltransferase family protein, partial [Bacteroidetes bacterium]|nr:CDP-alcohol phosphatidyltransferase family protein [Bacteroidota bacterium]